MNDILLRDHTSDVAQKYLTFSNDFLNVFRWFSANICTKKEQRKIKRKFSYWIDVYKCTRDTQITSCNSYLNFSPGRASCEAWIYFCFIMRTIQLTSWKKHLIQIQIQTFKFTIKITMNQLLQMYAFHFWKWYSFLYHKI